MLQQQAPSAIRHHLITDPVPLLEKEKKKKKSTRTPTFL
jgi:hypothetical protein